jgi:glycosyltransferase involved in cell wall biosynthesis
MKKIGIDARLYFQTGVGTYIQNLLSYLQKVHTESIIFYVYMRPQDIDKVSFKKNFIIRPTNAKWHSFKEQYLFPLQLFLDNLDLMHFTYFSSPLIYQKPFMTTIHDITNVSFKTGSASTKNSFLYNLKHIIFKKVLLNQVVNSKIIITPTQTAKNEIIAQYGQKYANKISCIYEGVHSELRKSLGKLSNIYPKEYLLYVGNFYPHKNIERLIDAYYDFDIPLVLHGPKDFFSQRIAAYIKTKKRGDIIILDNSYVTPSELSLLYQHAKALIFPSLSEGFGLPIVEAMKFDLPIIASDIPVFMELLGKSYISFDPYNSEDIHTKISEFIKRPHTFDYKTILSRFSFEKMTIETFALYKKLLHI